MNRPSPRFCASQHIVIEAAPSVVFELVGGFYTLTEWHPSCVAPEDGVVVANVGAKIRRRNRIKGLPSTAKTITEELVELIVTPEMMSYTYDYLEGSFNTTGYRSTIRCMPTEGGRHSVVQWSATWDCSEGDGGEEGCNAFYREGLLAAKQIIENKS